MTKVNRVISSKTKVSGEAMKVAKKQVDLGMVQANARFTELPKGVRLSVRVSSLSTLFLRQN